MREEAQVTLKENKMIMRTVVVGGKEGFGGRMLFVPSRIRRYNSE